MTLLDRVDVVACEPTVLPLGDDLPRHNSRLERDGDRKNNVEAHPAHEVGDVNHCVPDFELWNLVAIVDGFEAKGHRLSPDTTSEQLPSNSNVLNGALLLVVTNKLVAITNLLRGCSLGRVGRSTTTPAERPPFPEAA